MNHVTDPYILSNGVAIPCVGFGTWQVENGETAFRAVLEALKAGYRHIDTAQGYGNEQSVGDAVRHSGLKREDVFITSKLANSAHGYENTKAAFAETLRRLDTPYVDMFLIHWPNPLAFRDQWKEANAGSWKAMEELYRQGKIRALGISNFRPHHIEALLETADVAPAVNQIRLCPGNTQPAVADFSRKHHMLLEAYSPLGVGRVFKVPEIVETAQKYGVSVAQLCIRWSLQRGYLPLPKSVTPERIAQNADVFRFTLDEKDMALLSGLTGCAGEESDPDTTSF